MAEDATLRDRLALERTQLANERTLLSYIRTAIALVAAGASSIHFFEGVVSEVAGWALIVVGLVFQAVGARRYQRVRARLRS